MGKIVKVKGAYNRTVFKCETDEQRKELKRQARKRYSDKTKDTIKDYNKAYYQRTKEARKKQRIAKKEQVK